MTVDTREQWAVKGGRHTVGYEGQADCSGLTGTGGGSR